MSKLIAVFKVTAPDPNFVDDRPLYKVAKRLAKGPPRYMRCDSMQFPAWTKARSFPNWTLADSARRTIPWGDDLATMARYVAAFERANSLVPTIAATADDELQEAA